MCFWWTIAPLGFVNRTELLRNILRHGSTRKTGPDQLQAMDLSSVNSSIPWWPHSLPTPLCLNPPKTPVMPTPLGCSADQPGPEVPRVSALLVGDPTVCTAILPARI